MTAIPTTAWRVMPRPRLSSVPIYGRAYPESNAYPEDIPAQTLVPLQYTIETNQQYVTTGLVPTDYFYAQTFNRSLPHDGTVVIGNEKYYQITFNHRQAFVKAVDVELIE
jgi:hypothetical protein